jgi:hypothetical protein
MAARMATAPSSEAESSASEPWNLPIGVRAAETTTASRVRSGMTAMLLAVV